MSATMHPAKRVKYDSDVPKPPKYVQKELVGAGAYGEVYMGYLASQPDEIVAMKKLSEHEPVFYKAMMREVNLLQRLKHENIVTLREVYRPTNVITGRREPVMIMEYCHYDLDRIISNLDVQFSVGEIKQLMQQICTGLSHLQKQRVMHRDLKPANILVTKEGLLKLADFGLAKDIIDRSSGAKVLRFTQGVGTRWYRAPELLLGNSGYGQTIDMWAVGCIFAEMWIRTTLLPGSTEYDQLLMIFRLCGPPTPEFEKQIENLELFKSIEWPEKFQRQVVESLAPIVEVEDGLNLLDQLLELNPNYRPSANRVLRHSFFSTEPLPCSLARLMAQCDASTSDSSDNKSGSGGSTIFILPD